MKKFLSKAITAAAIMIVSGTAFAVRGTISAKEVCTEAVSDAYVSDETAPIQSKDTYEIGSVSKAVCAVACCKLADEGKLDLDAPVTEYLPEFKMKDERYKDITVRMLLDHTSGIMGDVSGGWYLNGDDDGSYHDEFLEKIAKQELKAAPGEYAVYCNSGFELAELIIERISGMSYGDFLQKEIAEPLGLDSFGTGYTGTDRERFINSKTHDGRNVPWQNCTNIASGGMWASADDLALFSRVLTDGNDFLSAESKARIMNIVSDEDGFGLGLDHTMLYPYNIYGKKAINKGGSLGNFQTALTVIPEDNLSVAVCTQGQGNYHPMMMCEDIIISVLKEEGLISEEDIKRGNAQIEEMLTEKECEDIPVPETLKKYAGLYGCRGIYEVGFEENFLTLENINSEFKQVYRFRYAGNGKFCSFDGNYISSCASIGKFSYKNAQNRGTMTIWFEEERGKIFLVSDTAEELKGIGTVNSTTQMLEKLSECTASEKAVNAWAEREGNTYRLVSEPYNSNNYLLYPTLKIRENSGYVCGYSMTEGVDGIAAVITDEYHTLSNTDVKGQGSRDLINYEIVCMNGAEYLRGEGYTGDTYRLYENFEGTASLSEKYVIDTPDNAVWFSVSPEDEGKALKLSVSEKAAWYVYDKHEKCIASSVYLDGSDRVILPEGGKLLLAGKKGEYINIIR